MAYCNQSNLLIEALPSSSRARLLPQLTPVSLTLREVLNQAGQPITTVYFPISGWVSTIFHMAEGRSAEVATIGREGVVGLSGGSGGSSLEQMVQGNGHALCLSKAAFDQELRDNQPLQRLISRYLGLIYVQTAITTACNGWHGLEQRFARWLLQARDLSDSDDLLLTQEFLAMMLCVHRPRVTTIARSLQMAGIITYNRGRIFIRDRDALEATACECYQAMRTQSEQFFASVCDVDAGQ